MRLMGEKVVGQYLGCAHALHEKSPSIYLVLVAGGGLLVFIPLAPFFFAMQFMKDCIQKVFPRSYAASTVSYFAGPLFGGELAGLIMGLIIFWIHRR